MTASALCRRWRGTGYAVACAFGTRRTGQQRAADARFAGLHRGRFKLYLRFGEPARTLRLDRWRRCAVFLPRAMFCRVRWEANDYGTIRWQLMVMQAATPLDDMQRIGVRPAARLLLHAEGENGACRAGTHRRHRRARHRRHRRVVRVLAHAGQLSGGPPGAARIHRRAARRLAGRKGAAMTTNPIPHARKSRASSLAPMRSPRAGGLRRRRPRCAGLGGFRVAAAASDLQPVQQRGGRLVSHRTVRPAHRLAATSAVRGQYRAGAATRQGRHAGRAARPADARAAAQTWARLRRNTSASSPGRYASTACLRPPCCLPTGWAGRCHPCSFAAALSRANCSC